MRVSGERSSKIDLGTGPAPRTSQRPSGAVPSMTPMSATMTSWFGAWLGIHRLTDRPSRPAPSPHPHIPPGPLPTSTTLPAPAGWESGTELGAAAAGSPKPQGCLTPTTKVQQQGTRPTGPTNGSPSEHLITAGRRVHQVPHPRQHRRIRRPGLVAHHLAWRDGQTPNQPHALSAWQASVRQSLEWITGREGSRTPGTFR